MSRSVTQKAVDAADALLDWLRTKPIKAEHDLSVDAGSTLALVEAENDIITFQKHDDFIIKDHFTFCATQPLRLSLTDWLHHRLVITGPHPDIAKFRVAAAGSGIISWHFDLARMEEDFFHLLVASPSVNSFQAVERGLSVSGARIFASQLREAVCRRHDLAVASVGRSTTCIFDLNSLVPVPITILALGPDDPTAVAWLWQHWGTTEPLRHVAESFTHPLFEPIVNEAGQDMFSLCFWSADWTPWQAVMQIRAAWPTLKFDINPTYSLL